MAHIGIMFTTGMQWASRAFESPDLQEAEQIAAQLAREYMALSKPAKD